MKLRTRASQSPLIKFAKFSDEVCINMVRFNKPYSDGAYTVYANDDTGNSSLCKTIESAEAVFAEMVNNAIRLDNKTIVELRNTINYNKPRHGTIK